MNTVARMVSALVATSIAALGLYVVWRWVGRGEPRPLAQRVARPVAEPLAEPPAGAGPVEPPGPEISCDPVPEGRALEDVVDLASDESFPASDPPSWTGTTLS